MSGRAPRATAGAKVAGAYASPVGKLSDLTSRAASALRGGAGTRAISVGPRPSQLLQLYEFESCPFCRRVREALTELDLSALIFPCPKRGTRHRPRVVAEGGRRLFPYLIDPGAGVSMYESRDIVRHLYARYGAGPPPSKGGPLEIATGSLASVVRLPAAGLFARPADEPARPPELYQVEGSPACRVVREALCRMEIAYRLRNVGEGGPARDDMRRTLGHTEIPCLVDPAAGVELTTPDAIVAHLRGTASQTT